MENKKIVLSSYILGSMLVWFLSRSIFQWLYLTFYQIRRLPSVIFLKEGLPFLMGTLCFVFLLKNARVNLVVDEVVSELRKVTWPNRPDVVRSTTVVIVCILVASVILATFDLIWGKLISVLLKG